MRLVVFSPMAASSAIGRVTKLVVTALVDQGHDVIVVRSEDDRFQKGPTHDLPVPMITWQESRAVIVAAAAADAVVYQIGDNYSLHRGCIEWLARIPGTVCLHDYFLGGLFQAWAERHRPNAEAVLRTWYGDAVASGYFRFENLASFIDSTSKDAPMTEWVASMALGVVTHSSWGIARVLAACPGPIQVLPLPYDAVFSTDSEIAGRSGQDGRFNVLTIGHVNPNKRAASVIRAIGSSDSLRSRTRYRLVGPIEPEIREELAALAARLKVDLSISGEVSDAELHRAIEHADVVCSLRWPALEAASASTIEAMLYGKAVLVLDTGFYGELPDAVVRKVAPGRELAGVQRELESLLRDPADRSALGQRAAAWAAVTFRAERYAEALAGLSRTAARTAPAVEASRFFAETLIGWGASVDSPSTTIVGESLGILE